jgi:hypothetical protein
VEEVSQPREWRDAALRVRLNHLRDLLRTLAVGAYDDCDPALLEELENCAGDLVTTVRVARRAIGM